MNMKTMDWVWSVSSLALVFACGAPGEEVEAWEGHDVMELQSALELGARDDDAVEGIDPDEIDYADDAREGVEPDEIDYADDDARDDDAVGSIDPDEIDYADDDAREGIEPDEIDYADDAREGVEPDEIDYADDDATDDDARVGRAAKAKPGKRRAGRTPTQSAERRR